MHYEKIYAERENSECNGLCERPFIMFKKVNCHGWIVYLNHKLLDDILNKCTIRNSIIIKKKK